MAKADSKAGVFEMLAERFRGANYGDPFHDALMMGVNEVQTK